MNIRRDLHFNPTEETDKLCKFISDSVKNFKSKGIVLGLSGGIDSACVCALAVRAIGSDKVFCLMLPEQDSDPKSEEDAIIVAKQYGVKTKTIDITSVLEAFKIYELIPKNFFSHREQVAKLVRIGYSLFPKGHSPFVGGFKGTKLGIQRQIQAYYRVKHRVRMLYLYYYGEQLDYLVAGTSNKTEYLTGFFVKYGDGAADIMPIINLYKTQVRKLSEHLGVPKQVIDKPPVPDLIPGLEDERVIGLSYEKLDSVLVGIMSSKSTSEISNELELSVSAVDYVKNIIDLSKLLRSVPYMPDA
jgi:NAD+ synthase